MKNIIGNYEILEAKEYWITKIKNINTGEILKQVQWKTTANGILFIFEGEITKTRIYKKDVINDGIRNVGE